MVADAFGLDPIDDPQGAVNCDAFCLCHLPENAVARQQGPLPAIGERESERVGDRQPLLTAKQSGGSSYLGAIKGLDDNAKRTQPLTEHFVEFAFEQEVGNDKLVSELEGGLQQITSVEVDDYRGVGNQEWHR